MRFCTAVTSDYLPQAVVLARSLARWEPTATMVVAVLGDPDAEARLVAEPLQVFDGSELLDAAEFDLRASRYDGLELIGSLKPVLMRALVRNEPGSVCWLDADMRICGPVEPLWREIVTAPCSMAPHLSRPLPADGLWPDDRAIAHAGALNSGVVGSDGSAEGDALLGWWAERLSRQADRRGDSADQLWLTLLPGYSPRVRLLRDPGVNVAYWNLWGRIVVERDGRWLVDEEPLRILHLSGFDPSAPSRLSSFDSRIDLARLGDLRLLLAEHARELLEARASVGALPWPHRSFPGGALIDARARRVLRSAIDAGDLAVPVGTGPTGAAAREWLLAPGSRAGGLSRYLDVLRHEDASLRDAFPDPSRDGRRFACWARAGGLADYAIDVRLAHGPALLAGLHEQAPPHPAGVPIAPSAPVVCLDAAGDPDGAAALLRQIAATVPAGTPVLVNCDARAAGAPDVPRDALVLAPGLTADELVALAAPGDAVLVRAGARLSPAWLEGLWAAAHDVADSGGSVPVDVVWDPEPSSAAAARRRALFRRPATARTHGPCIYLRRDALESAGTPPIESLADAFAAIGSAIVLADEVLVGWAGPHVVDLPAARRARSISDGVRIAVDRRAALGLPGGVRGVVERLAAALVSVAGSSIVDLASAADTHGDSAAEVVFAIGPWPTVDLPPGARLVVVADPAGAAAAEADVVIAIDERAAVSAAERGTAAPDAIRTLDAASDGYWAVDVCRDAVGTPRRDA